MKILLFILLSMAITSCSNEKEIPILKTSSKILSIKDGAIFHKNIWTISPEVELDEFVPSTFRGKKEISFISDIDTLTFTVSHNNMYTFFIEYKQEKAFTRINTSTLKPSSIPSKLEYTYKDKSKKFLVDTIPFTIGPDSRIYLKGKINNSEALDFMFDTGANGIVIVSKLIGSEVQLELDGETGNEGSDGVQTITTSSGNLVEIGNLKWEQVNLLSIDFQNPKFDIVLGWIAFENKIVEIEYDDKKLFIHTTMETVSKEYNLIETKMIGGVPYIKGRIRINDNESTGWFEYDSGSDGSFKLSQKYASENNLNGVMKKVGTSISSGSAGVTWKSNNYILPNLQFGAYELLNVPVNILEKDPEGIEHNNILGNKILKRFNAVIDFQNFQIYLKPNTLFYSTY